MSRVFSLFTRTRHGAAAVIKGRRRGLALLMGSCEQWKHPKLQGLGYFCPSVSASAKTVSSYDCSWTCLVQDSVLRDTLQQTGRLSWVPWSEKWSEWPSGMLSTSFHGANTQLHFQRLNIWKTWPSQRRRSHCFLVRPLFWPLYVLSARLCSLLCPHTHFHLSSADLDSSSNFSQILSL